MSRQIVKKPQSERDLIELYAFIATDKIKPAERFLRVAADAFDLLAEMPGIGRKWESPRRHLKGIRVYPLPSPYRNYLVFYRATDTVLEILTVVHGARDLKSIVDALPKD